MPIRNMDDCPRCAVAPGWAPFSFDETGIQLGRSKYTISPHFELNEYVRIKQGDLVDPALDLLPPIFVEFLFGRTPEVGLQIGFGTNL